MFVVLFFGDQILQNIKASFLPEFVLKFVLKNKIAGRVSVIQYTEFGKSTYLHFHI